MYGQAMRCFKNDTIDIKLTNLLYLPVEFSYPYLLALEAYHIPQTSLCLSHILTRICAAQRHAQDAKINKHITAVGAQCSPRHACPLNGALLMQVHRAQGAPVLARERDSVT
jgi:hypothetical protein